MDYKTIRWEVEDRILTLTLSRPDQLNAFTVEMANELSPKRVVEPTEFR